MSENSCYKAVDLLVIITRLHANRDAHEDEFKHDWTPPDGPPQRVNILSEKSGFWMLSKDGKAGLLVIHGYNGLLDKAKGAFQTKVLELIRTAGLDQKSFSRLAVFAHGQIPEAEAELGREKTDKPLLTDALDGTFASVLRNNYTTHGNEPVALALPRMLRDAGIGETLRIMVASGLKLEPAVDAAVRSMQHILLEIRLWCDLWFSKNQDYDQKTKDADKEGLKRMAAEMRGWSAELNNCIARLKNSDHWKGRAIQSLPGIKERAVTLRQFLCEDEDRFGDFFEQGVLEQISDRAEMDDFLRLCSCRLEQLIRDAAEKDKRGAAS